MATFCLAGMASGVGPPPLAIFRPQDPHGSVHLGNISRFHLQLAVVLCIPSATLFYNLVTKAEIKWIKQLIMHRAIMSRISMVTIGVSKVNSHFQNLPLQEESPQKSGGFPAFSQRSWIICMFFSRTKRLSSILFEVFTQNQQVSLRIAQVLPCFAVQRSIAHLFLSITCVSILHYRIINYCQYSSQGISIEKGLLELQTF